MARISKTAKLIVCSTSISFLDFRWNYTSMLSLGQNYLAPNVMVAYDTAVCLSQEVNVCILVNHHLLINPSQFIKLLKKVKVKGYWRRGFNPSIFPTTLPTSTGGATLPAPTTEVLRLFRILYAGLAGINEFSGLSALSHSPKMFAVNICIQDPIEPVLPRNSTRATKRGFLRWRLIRQATRKISSRLSIAMMKRTIMSGLRWSCLKACFPPSINFPESLSYGKHHG